MPLLVINMSGEMTYILEQRLHAQNVADEKANKVLYDVLRTTYNKKFISELFRPQKVYTSKGTREIFDRLAHSSIMRLNSSSMDKLYDLMCMGFKYQLTKCVGPEEFIQITLNHMENLKKIANHETIDGLVDDAMERVIDAYSNMSQGNLYLLKQTLCDFFQDHRVKVSIFLHENVQNMDGSFKINPGGRVIRGGDIPGQVRTFDSRGNECSTGHLRLVTEGKCQEATRADGVRDRPCRLGDNMYARAENGTMSRATPKQTSAAISGTERSSERPNNPSKRNATKKLGNENDNEEEGATLQDKKVSPTTGSSGHAELNLLANLLGRAIEDTEGKSNDDSHSSSPLKPFRINLFTEDPFTGADSGGGGGFVERSATQVRIDGRSSRKTVRETVASFGFDDSSTCGGKKRDDSDDDDEDDLDLLAMMDEASHK